MAVLDKPLPNRARSAVRLAVRRPEQSLLTAQGRVDPKRLLFLALLLGAAGWAIRAQMGDVHRTLQTLMQGRPPGIALAIGLQTAYFVSYTGLHQIAFGASGVRRRVRDLLPVWFTSVFTGVIAPGASPAVFALDAAQSGVSVSQTMAGMLLVRIADFATLLVIIGVGFAVLSARGQLHAYQVGAALILAGNCAVWVALLVLAHRFPGLLCRLLNGIKRIVNHAAGKLRRPPPLADDWAEHAAGDFARSAQAIARPRALLSVLGAAMAAHLLDMASLAALLWAFHAPAGGLTVMTGFGIGLLFWIVSVTPEGIGIVEVAMPSALAALGVPLDSAVLATLGFRGLTLYLPIALGAIFASRAAVRPLTGPVPEESCIV